MDLVHDRGSMDPVHERGSMDPVHFLMDLVHGPGPRRRSMVCTFPPILGQTIDRCIKFELKHFTGIFS